jgi:hypothetical protein
MTTLRLPRVLRMVWDLPNPDTTLAPLCYERCEAEMGSGLRRPKRSPSGAGLCERPVPHVNIPSPEVLLIPSRPTFVIEYASS